MFLEFESLITVLHDEVEKSCYLADWSRMQPPQAPQLQLLEEWSLEGDIPWFCRKLCVVPEVFVGIIQCIEGHPVFMNASNNPQLPVPIQLAIFLNAAGHYGNASTTEDLAEWAGVSIGTVYNCFRHVMITILQHHNDAIHFDPMEARDQGEIWHAKVWVENKGCFDWWNRFLCMDGSPFNLFQKPGWHGEGFYDRKSQYSLLSQVSIVCYHRVGDSPQLLGCHHAAQSSDCWLCDRGTWESSWLNIILTCSDLSSPPGIPRHKWVDMGGYCISLAYLVCCAIQETQWKRTGSRSENFQLLSLISKCHFLPISGGVLRCF